MCECVCVVPISNIYYYTCEWESERWIVWASVSVSEIVSFEGPFILMKHNNGEMKSNYPKTKTRITCNWNILKKETKNSQSNSLKKQQKVQQTNLDPRRICGGRKTEGVTKKKKRYFCAIFYTSVEQSKRRNLKLRRMTHFGRYSSF